MTGFLGIFATEGGRTDTRTVRSMLAGLASRGTECEVRGYADGSSTLGVVRHAWELDEGLSGRVLVAEDGPLGIVADASLYYQQDLRRALSQAGIQVRGDTPSHLILAAYRAWGDRCAERLEGDFAFVLWDGNLRRVVCARDFGGKRPLFYAEFGNTFAVASTISALRGHPRCPDDLDSIAIGAAAAGLFAVAHETAYRRISQLPAGSTLVREAATTRIAPHWVPPRVREGAGPGFEEAAAELRRLLQSAVRERLDPGGPTGVWLSGGWDSTAVFGAGEQELLEQGSDQHLHAISISFPPGDPGREDELIQSVVQRWGSPISWLDIADIPLFDRPLRCAGVREQPFAHAFENCNRALAAGSRAAGARIALDGVGGDQLFQVSNVYLSDLFRTGRWPELAREWRVKGLGGGFRSFFHGALQPLLPPPILRAVGTLRGKPPLRGQLERPLPDWIDRAFLRRTGLVERERQHTPRRTGADRAAYETEWYLSHPYFPRAFGCVHDFALAQGVEVRSPLYDARIVNFAAVRPRSERSRGAETKRLLRRAVQGLVPDQVLEPRASRTGSVEGYFAHSMRATYAMFLSQLIDGSMCLARLGVVEPSILRRRWDDYVRRGGGELGVNLYLTLQAELWLRARSRLGEKTRTGAAAGSYQFDAVAATPSPYGRAARDLHDVQEEPWMAKAANT
ncbi:MAG TPA: asparagine synthase-related protein [Gemmatimonadales bacterium]|nr:asparagine synthase-related protein [Gemmatimonadales bacterium]